jgi:outer membrane assembly lipoprotein YfiO
MIKTIKYIILAAFSFFSLHNTTATQQQFDVSLPITEKKSHKQRMRKPRDKKPKVKKTRTYMDMDYDTLVAAKNAQKENNNIPVTIKYVDQLMKLCNNITLLADYLLELADLLFIDNQFQKASFLYLQYCALYPGSEKQEYAFYRSIASAFACILPVDRDQTKTEETLILTQQFLQQDHFTAYKNEVLAIQTQCHQQLATSECNICNFYLIQGKLRSAERRLKKIRSDWLPKLPTLEPDIIILETQLAAQKETAALLHEKRTQIAHNKKTKHMANRF